MKTCILTLLVLVPVIGMAQLDYEIINSQSVDKEIQNVTADNDGNVILTGLFSNTITFGSFVLHSSTPNQYGRRAAFIAKKNTDGTYAFAKVVDPLSIPGSQMSNAMIEDVATDASGNIYVTGIFTGKIALDNNTLTSVKLIHYYTSDMFTAKLSSSGAFQWAKREGTNMDHICLGEYGRSVAVDDQGNVYSAGEMIYQKFSDQQCSCGPDSADAVAPCVYVVKYNSSGHKKWDKKYFNTEQTGGYCFGGGGCSASNVRSDGTYIYVNGKINGNVDFGNVTLNTDGLNNQFLLKLDNSGNTVWANLVTNSGNSTYAVGYGLYLDDSGNAYMTGLFNNGTLDFGDCSLTAGGQSAYMVKYAPSGVCEWATAFPGISYGVTPHPDGNLEMLVRKVNPQAEMVLKELSPTDGAPIDSVVGVPVLPLSYAFYSGLSGTPDGFMFTLNLHGNGSYDFGDLSVSSVGTSNWDLALITYTDPGQAQMHVLPPSVVPSVSDDIMLYPNPADDLLHLRNNSNNALGNVTIYDLSGSVVYHEFIARPQTEIDIKNFSKGLYCVMSEQTPVRFVKQ